MEENMHDNFDETIRNENIYPNNEKKDKKKKIIFICLLCVLVAIVSSLASFITVSVVMKNRQNTVVVYETEEKDTVTVVTASDYSQLVEDVKDSVVEVYTESVSYNSYLSNYVTEGAGSGVIYTSDGYIITNNHVIEDASTIKVTLSSGEQCEATLVASDSYTDIAVIKIEKENLKPVVLGDSDSLVVGQNCVVIGNPLGTLGGSVTSGIISALSRTVTIDSIPMTLLQTDAAISPGNSGGGMFDTSGNLIGIVNAKSVSENAEGIGFAIPVNLVKSIAEDLIEYGYVSDRPVLGISGVSIESVQSAWNYGVNSYGVYVKEVTSENAKNAGLKEGDLIVAVNGTTVQSFAEMQVELYKCKINDQITVTVLRNNSKVDLTVTLQARK